MPNYYFTFLETHLLRKSATKLDWRRETFFFSDSSATNRITRLISSIYLNKYTTCKKLSLISSFFLILCPTLDLFARKFTVAHPYRPLWTTFMKLSNCSIWIFRPFWKNTIFRITLRNIGVSMPLMNFSIFSRRCFWDSITSGPRRSVFYLWNIFWIFCRTYKRALVTLCSYFN